MGTFQDVTTATMERGNSTRRGLDTAMSLQKHQATITNVAAAFGRISNSAHHLRFSFSSLNPAPARVAVVSLR